MLITIIFMAIAVYLILERFMIPQKDEAARNGLKQLAQKLNRKIYFYNSIGESLLQIDNFDKERGDCDKLRELERKLSEDMIKLAQSCKKSDEDHFSDIAFISNGLEALAKHFKVRLVSYHKPEERGFKVEKLKK